MDRIARALLITMLLTDCASPPPPERVSKSRWLECWALCGKKDNLAAVTNALCICKGGVKIERDVDSDTKDEEKAETPALELFDWLMK